MTAAVAEEVGRAQHQPPPPGAAAAISFPPPPEPDPDWQMIENTPPGYEAGSIRGAQYVDVDPPADVDVPANRLDIPKLPKRKRKLLARHWAKITLEHIGVMMRGTLGPTMLKARDMQAATRAAEDVSQWMNVLAGEVGSEATGVSPGGLAAGRTPTHEEIRQGLSDASDVLEEHLSKIKLANKN